MTPELENKLFRRFPLMYRTYYAPATETCMCWGFSHGDGWFDIIWQLSLAIEDELDYGFLKTRWYLFLDKFARRWNKLIYRLSPVQEQHWHFEGSGKAGDPIHRVYDPPGPLPLDEKIARFLFGEKEKIGDFEVGRIFLKKLAMNSIYTGFSVAQVKEKFGTLRFYTDGNNERIYRLIRFAEELSAVTCEDCGKYGQLRGGGWIRTLCDDCAKLRGYDEKEEQDDSGS